MFRALKKSIESAEVIDYVQDGIRFVTCYENKRCFDNIQHLQAESMSLGREASNA